MTIYDELRARDLMPICAGVAPGAPLAPGFDGARVQIAMTDWDNSTQADCRIKAIAEAFPNALLYYELPSGDEMSGWIIFPDADSCSSVTPTSTNGGAWIRSVQQKYPGFTGVLYETVQPEGHAANVEQLTKLNGWWRDVQQVLFETDTYWIFWHNLDHDERRAANDALLASCPWLHGYMSGGTSHPRIPDHQTDPSTIDAQGMDMIDIHAAAVVESPDFRSWPITTHISRVILSLTGVRVDFDKKDGPDRWPDNVTPGWDGPLQYSLGMAMLIDGRWYVDAPIEVWHGLEESGGSIQNQEVTNPQFPDLKGQIQCNWFYSPQRWGPMAGHRPQPGEQIGLFVVAGDCRSHFNPIQERSNIVLLPLPNTRVAADFDVTT
jgi:hypothetical protein